MNYPKPNKLSTIAVDAENKYISVPQYKSQEITPGAVNLFGENGQLTNEGKAILIAGSLALVAAIGICLYQTRRNT